MAIYYVKTGEFTSPSEEGPVSRTLIIEADYYDHINQNDYAFYRKNPVDKKAKILVASVPQRDVFAILEEEAYQEDYIAGYSEDEPDEDEFFDRVWDIVSLWHEPDPEDHICDECLAAEQVQPVPVPDTPVAVPDAEPVVEHWSNGDDDVWGFQTPNGFVHFSDRLSAESGLESHKKYPGINWLYQDLTGYSKVVEYV